MCSADEKAAMQSKATQIGLKNAIENGEPLFVSGVAQPIFPYTSGVPTKDGYSNDKSDIIRYSVYVETNYDTDGDGKLDLVKALVQLPRAAAEGKYKAAAIYMHVRTSPAARITARLAASIIPRAIRAIT